MLCCACEYPPHLLVGEKFPFNQAVTKTFACLIRSVSPQVLLEVIPLNLAGESSESRDWLLPLMKDNVSAHSSLMFFAAYFVRLHAQLETRIQEYTDNGMMTSARWLRGVANNIWELFPSFCNLPSEVVTVRVPLCVVPLMCCPVYVYVCMYVCVYVCVCVCVVACTSVHC
jgi:Ribosomal RNA-processing protein 12, HEAT repeats